jgi:hypothetical protein
VGPRLQADAAAQCAQSRAAVGGAGAAPPFLAPLTVIADASYAHAGKVSSILRHCSFYSVQLAAAAEATLCCDRPVVLTIGWAMMIVDTRKPRLRVAGDLSITLTCNFGLQQLAGCTAYTPVGLNHDGHTNLFDARAQAPKHYCTASQWCPTSTVHCCLPFPDPTRLLFCYPTMLTMLCRMKSHLSSAQHQMKLLVLRWTMKLTNDCATWLCCHPRRRFGYV